MCIFIAVLGHSFVGYITVKIYDFLNFATGFYFCFVSIMVLEI